MVDKNQVRTAFRTRLLANFPEGGKAGDIVNGQPLPFDVPTYMWEDKDITMNAAQFYIEERLIPVLEMLSATAMLEWTGIYQLSILAPAGSGTELPDALVKAFGTLFPPASSVGVNDTPLATGAAIMRTERGQPYSYAPAGSQGAGSWKAHPLSVTHKAFAFLPSFSP